jgi:tetratricopeptide (TPR) repeat protein
LFWIAKTYAELKQKEQALALINQAHSDHPNEISLLSIQLLAELGADHQAKYFALNFSKGSGGKNSLSLSQEQDQGRARILGEVALSRFKQDLKLENLKDIKAMTRFLPRLELWLRALIAANQEQDDEALAGVKTALTEELGNLSANFDTGLDYDEKRQAIHAVAKLLRHDTLSLNPEQQLATLQELVQQAHYMYEDKEGTKALCELGYTAQKLNQPALAKTLFDEGTALSMKGQQNVRLSPIDPPTLGACAYWLKAAGESDKANTLIAKLLKLMPESLDKADTIGLINVAISFAEYEKGEALWRENSRLEP